MSVNISGRLIDAAGKPVSGCVIELRAKKTSLTVVVNVTSSNVTGSDGAYSITAEPGYYAVTLLREGFPPAYAGEIYVAPADKPDTLNAFLDAPKDGDLRPEVMKRFEAMVNQVVVQSAQVSRDKDAAAASAAAAAASAASASDSKSAAATSATNAANSATAAASSASSAQASKDAAASSASAAAASATAAAGSKTAAANSATAAATSATNAANSATAARSSESNAADSASAAAASASSSASSAAASEASESAAALSASRAEESATTAAAAASDAMSFADSAGSSSADAEQSAAQAAESAADAALSASEAKLGVRISGNALSGTGLPASPLHANPATETTEGVVKLATQALAQGLSDTNTATTPKNISDILSSTGLRFSSATTPADMNSAISANTYIYSTFNTVTNLPSGASGGGLLMVILRAQYPAQMLFTYNGQLFFRVKSSAGWQPWIQTGGAPVTGGVGTYVHASSSDAIKTLGQTVAGSALTVVNSGYTGALSGTWQCCGGINSTTAATIWYRIA